LVAIIVGSESNNHVLATGEAGFIGSHLAEALIRKGKNVSVLDNLSRESKYGPRILGRSEYLSFVEGDLLDRPALETAMENTEIVSHRAANPEVSIGASDTSTDLQQSVTAAHNILEVARKDGDVKIQGMG